MACDDTLRHFTHTREGVGGRPMQREPCGRMFKLSDDRRDAVASEWKGKRNGTDRKGMSYLNFIFGFYYHTSSGTVQ